MIIIILKIDIKLYLFIRYDNIFVARMSKQSYVQLKVFLELTFQNTLIYQEIKMDLKIIFYEGTEFLS